MENVVVIKNLIYEIRGQKVMLDSDLAELYEIELKKLNQAVKRNIERFPSDFMFQLTKEEWDDFNLKSHIVTSSWGGKRKLPYVFTEQGVAMLSGILRTSRAIEVNIRIMRTFVEMRQWALENKDLGKRLSDLEQYFINYCKENNTNIDKIYEALDLLMDRTRPNKIGFDLK